MAKLGIWIDLNEAQIVQIENAKLSIKTIKSDINIGRIKGGSRSKIPWGPMDKVSESKQLAKRESQLKSYLETVSQVLNINDELLLVGPAQTKTRFKKFLLDNNLIKSQNIEVQAEDSMTENQLVAMVKYYFEWANAAK